MSLLSSKEAASVLEHDKSILTRLEERKELAPADIGPRRAKLWDSDQVDALKPVLDFREEMKRNGFAETQQGKRYTVAKAHEEFGVSEQSIRDAIADGSLPHQELDPPPTGPTPWATVLEKDVRLLKNRLSVEVRKSRKSDRDRWRTQKMLCEEYAPTKRDRFEVFECARCWRKLGWLASDKLLIEQNIKIATSRAIDLSRPARNGKPRRIMIGARPGKRHRKITVLDRRQFHVLWTDTCSVEKGAKEIRRFLSVAEDKRATATVLKTHMEKLGFAGTRFYRACTLANVIRKPAGSRGSPWVYELAPGKPGKPKDPVAFLEALHKKGPVLVTERNLAWRNAGLQPRHVRKAIEQLGITPKQYSFGAKWYSCLPGQEPPVSQKINRWGPCGAAVTSPTAAQAAEQKPLRTPAEETGDAPGATRRDSGPATESGSPVIVLKGLKARIWHALDGRALKKRNLCKELRVSGKKLYAALNPMIEAKIVRPDRGIGYYRPDSPPVKKVPQAAGP